jgi:methylenetetrahydrofolate dehydrogenase (NADP+)/methenyltetrahydrofolate cyclohydrolase
LPENTSSQELEKVIISLNNNHETSSYFVQLPIPNIVDSSSVLNKILPGKDADGLSSINLGLLFQQHVNAVAPATAVGIVKLLDEYKIPLEGKKIVVVNDSPIVGLPLLALFNGRYATVTLCHVHTQNLSEVTSQADILVSATGVIGLITASMVKDKVVAIDVGGGDIDFENVSKKASFITPTFGGVGPMTVASLLENTYTLAIRK